MASPVIALPIGYRLSRWAVRNEEESMKTTAALPIGRVAAVALALACAAVPARAETTNCPPITSVPYLITVPGVYCLTGNISTAMGVGAAIEIATNNVTLDLNGFKLGGLAAGTGTTAAG